MSNGDGIVQTNQPFSMKENKKKSESYEQPLIMMEENASFVPVFSFFLQWKRTKREKASTLRTNAASLLPNQRAATRRPSDFCYEQRRRRRLIVLGRGIGYKIISS